MALIPFRANLNAAEIPFLSSQLGRTVIIPGLDQNSVKSAQFAGSGESLDQGIPQLLYAHNVMPTDFGVQSVGYTKIIDKAVSQSGRLFDQLMTLRDVNEAIYLFSPAKGDCWTYDASFGRWKSTFQLTPAFTGRHVSKSSINGRSFVCFEKRGFFEYSKATQGLVEVNMAGLVNEEILGITNSGNYNIAYTVDTLLWSSLTDETDFVPSLSTGAGSAIPQDLKGPIVCVLPVSGGMIIYTTKNIVVGLATNNARFPFNFKEIANGGGLSTSEHASFENGLGTHYAWTSAGLQKITTSAAETVFPAATDFLAGRRIEEFDEETLDFITYLLTTDIRIKLTFLESRYLVISYGAQLGSNLISWSENYLHDSWQPIGFTQAPLVDEEDPVGTFNATRLTYTGAPIVDGVGGTAFLGRMINNITTEDSTYTFSIYIKSDVVRDVRISLADSDGIQIFQQDYEIGSVWSRISVTGSFTAVAGEGVLCELSFLDADASEPFLADLFGAQLELDATPSKYVRTTYGARPDGAISGYDYALVFDTALKRWGKLKIGHVDAFFYAYPRSTDVLPYKEWTGSYTSWVGTSYSQLKKEGSITPVPKKSIGFLKDDGTVYLLNFEFDAVTKAVLLLGKYQLTRTSLSTLHTVEVENPNVVTAYTWDPLNPNTETERQQAAADNETYFQMRVLASLDGRNFGSLAVPELFKADDDLLVYNCRNTAISHTLYFAGSFHLRTVILKVTKHGKR